MANPVSHLESHAGYWLRLVSNHVSHALRLKVESHGVTVAEWVVMRALFDTDSVHPSQLADALGLTRGAVTKLVTRLEDMAFVVRRSVKEDRRYQVIALTKSGRGLVPTLAAVAEENNREFFGALTASERSKLVAMLKVVAEHRGLRGAPVD